MAVSGFVASAFYDYRGAVVRLYTGEEPRHLLRPPWKSTPVMVTIVSSLPSPQASP